MKKLILFTISVYKKMLSPFLEAFLGKGCRFTPTCSQYAAQAVEKYGVIKGGVFTLKRIARCHPLSEIGFDPVP